MLQGATLVSYEKKPPAAASPSNGSGSRAGAPPGGCGVQERLRRGDDEGAKDRAGREGLWVAGDRGNHGEGRERKTRLTGRLSRGTNQHEDKAPHKIYHSVLY